MFSIKKLVLDCLTCKNVGESPQADTTFEVAGNKPFKHGSVGVPDACWRSRLFTGQSQIMWHVQSRLMWQKTGLVVFNLASDSGIAPSGDRCAHGVGRQIGRRDPDDRG
jgi:hypothetical protein